MAKLIDSNSAPSSKSELDFFSVPPTQVAIDHGYWHVARLVDTCRNEGPWRFRVEADPHYLQLNKNFLWMKFKIVDENGDDIVDDGVNAPPLTAPINLIGSTFFKQLKVSLNGKLIFDSGDTYAYRCFLETVLNYGSEAKKGHLSVAGYTKDETVGGAIDVATNTGVVARANPYKNSRVVEVMVPLHCDLFMTNRLLLTNTELLIELHRNSDAFSLLCFTANTTRKFEIIDMAWYIRKVEISNSMHLAIEQTLQRVPAKYPIRRIKIAKLGVQEGRFMAPTNTLFVGQIPRRLVIGCVDSDAYFGNIAKSPFWFKNCNIVEITVNAGGRIYPRQPLETDFPNDLYVRAYLQMLEGIGIGGENTHNDISYKDFKEHLCLFVFDLTPDEQDAGHWQLLREGSTSINVKFNPAVPAGGIEILVYAEFDNLLFIDRLRNLHADYTV